MVFKKLQVEVTCGVLDYYQYCFNMIFPALLVTQEIT